MKIKLIGRVIPMVWRIPPSKQNVVFTSFVVRN